MEDFSYLYWHCWYSHCRQDTRDGLPTDC